MAVVVPDTARTASLLQQPFVVWCLLLRARGNGMRGVRRFSRRFLMLQHQGTHTPFML